MSGARPPWDFGYAPVSPAARPPVAARAWVLATRRAIDPARVIDALDGRAGAETILARAPLFWTRVRFDEPADRAAITARLGAIEAGLRYLASAEAPDLALGEPLDLRGAATARADAWPVAPARGAIPEATATAAGAWFLRDGEGGVAVDRARSGGGGGTRLAVIDDDALHADRLDLDAEVLIELEHAPRHAAHGPLMVAWASGARGFAGVAPDASARLYLIPKPGRSLSALPLAIARAALDGADVIVCATYVEGSTSPMLDDALTVARRLGRGGRGAAVVLPTGRETSSPPGSRSASFSLGFGEPASDPRVICVGPSARGEGWFLWRDRRGLLRPFANRGPAVRWLAPGDDIADPFRAIGAPERLCHAESSGAAAVAAGALLLVLARNPTLGLADLAAVVDAALAPVPADPPAAGGPIADAADLRPRVIDRDGHNAKHGFGRIDVGRACLSAADPVCAALIAIGADDAARAHADARRDDPRVARAYSRRLARWAARALLRDGEAARMLAAIARHLRLVAGRSGRRRAHGDGALARQIRLLVRRLVESRPGPRTRAELALLDQRLGALDVDGAERFEAALDALAARLFVGGPAAPP